MKHGHAKYLCVRRIWNDLRTWPELTRRLGTWSREAALKTLASFGLFLIAKGPKPTCKSLLL